MDKNYREDIGLCVITDELSKVFSHMVSDNRLLTENRMIKIGAFIGNEPVGVCFISINQDDRSVLEWIYVAKDFRRQGVASSMLDEYIRFAQKRNMNTLEMCFEPLDYEDFVNEGAAFLEHMGFLLCKSQGNYSVDYNNLMSNRKLSALKIPAVKLSTLDDYLEQKSHVFEMKRFLNDKDIPESVLEEKMCKEASYVITGNNKNITSILLSSRKGSGMGLDLIVSSSGAENDILAMLKSLYEYIKSANGKISKLYFCALNPKVNSLIGYFFGKEFESAWQRVYGAMYIE